MVKKSILGLILVVMLFGCTTDKEVKIPEDSVALVFGESILKSELDGLVTTYSKIFEENNGYAPSDQEIDSIKNNILESLIEKKVFIRKFDDLGLVFDETSVQNQVNQVKASFQTEEAYAQELEKNGFTAETFQEEVRFQFKMMALGDYIKNQELEITDEEIENYYNTNKEMFYNEEGLLAEASHILITPDENMSDEQALAKITEIKNEISNGLAFSDAAKQYSQCPSAEDGGDLGSFPPGAMVAEFDQAVFSMELNTVSEPIKTQFGYHLILTTNRNENPYEPLENVKDYIAVKIKEQTFIDQSYEEANVQRATAAEQG